MALNGLRLFHSLGLCSAAAHILLKDSGLFFSTEMIDVIETITEIPAIITTIAQLVPDKKFLGSTNLEIVRSYKWFNFLAGELHAQGYFTIYRSHYFIDDEAAYDKICGKGRGKIERCYDIIEGKLQGMYAVGNVFSAVDAYLLPFYR